MTTHVVGSLTREETFLWDCARSWRQPSALAIPDPLDWERVVTVTVANRMPTLLHGVLNAARADGRLAGSSAGGTLNGGAQDGR